ncbi:MAG: AmmeMemoRadiSam system protein B [Candidatus Aminicenantes bacterium]|nr:AmmeMemoRadiSam system protein B [Candidatus Aminicenantes bacterium]
MRNRALTGLTAAILFVAVLAAQETRPVRDDVGYCWNTTAMKALVDFLEKEAGDSHPAEGLVAAVAPHDDYLYAGRVYHPLFKILRTREVVVFGVTHGAVRKEIGDPQSLLILDSFKDWPGLDRPVGVSELREHIKTHLDKSFYAVNNTAHALEHSIEGQVPWLHYFNPEVRITPIMVTGMPFEKMEEISTRLAETIAAYMKDRGLVPGRDVFFLISSDGNHYGRDFDNAPFGEDETAWKTARELDRRLIREYLTGPMDEGKVEGLTRELWGETYLDYRNTYWCGKYSVPFGLLAAQKIVALTTGKKISGTLLRDSDTYSEGVLPLVKTGLGTTAPFSLRHWVSFCSIGYYLD